MPRAVTVREAVESVRAREDVMAALQGALREYEAARFGGAPLGKSVLRQHRRVLARITGP